MSAPETQAPAPEVVRPQALDVDGKRGGSGLMFDAIAERYDFVNRVISLGLDHSWRSAQVKSLELAADQAAFVLDLAAGTGDVALRIADAHPGSKVVGIDPSEGMLAVARRKAGRRALDERVTFEVGDAQALPQADGTVDGITIAFGIRNVPDREKALREMLRVLKPGARAAILELGEPRSGVLGALARFHIRTVVPQLGALLSGKGEYRYLQKSIAAFPPPDTFADLLRTVGFTDVHVRHLTFGVAHLYIGAKPAAAPEA